MRTLLFVGTFFFTVAQLSINSAQAQYRPIEQIFQHALSPFYSHLDPAFFLKINVTNELPYPPDVFLRALSKPGFVRLSTDDYAFALRRDFANSRLSVYSSKHGPQIYAGFDFTPYVDETEIDLTIGLAQHVGGTSYLLPLQINDEPVRLVAASTVPEPSSLVCSSLALVGLSAMRRRFGG